MTLELLGERFRGTLHNGLDDSKNIGVILLKMIKGGANPVQNERILLDVHDQNNNPPAHKYDLRTVQYIHPREFHMNLESRGSGYRGRNYNHQFNQERTYNKENWTQRAWSGSPPEPSSMPSPTPERRVNKLKNALREASRENTDDESASLNKNDKVPTSGKGDPTSNTVRV